MKKPNQKECQKYLKKIPINLSKLINAIIWYETHDMDDWSSDLVSKILNEDDVCLVTKKLCEDILLRSELECSNICYHELWYGYLNADQEKYKTHDIIIEAIMSDTTGKIYTFLQGLDDGGNSRGEQNVRFVLGLSIHTIHHLP